MSAHLPPPAASPPPLGSAAILRRSELRQAAVSLSLLVAAAAVVLVVALRPSQAMSPLPLGPVLGCLLLLSASAGALYRPPAASHGGLGVAAAPLWLATGSVALAASLLGAVVICAGLGQRALARRLPHRPSERRRWSRSLVEASRAVIACAVAGLVPVPLEPGPPGVVVRALVFGGVACLLQALERRLRGRSGSPPVSNLLLLAAAWGFGESAVAAGRALGPGTAVVLVSALALVPLAATFERWHRQALELRLGHLRQLQHDDEEELREPTMSADSLDDALAGPLDRLGRATRRSTGCDWLALRLTAPEGHELGSWHAGPRGGIQAGLPNPPRWAPPLPGIHRRTPWRRLAHGTEVADGHRVELLLWCDPRRLEPGAAELLPSLAERWASELDRALLGHQARLDALTGLGVRRVFERALARRWEDAVRRQRPLAVVLCDIDHFKAINDRWGHPVGDRVLVEVASRLRRSLRSGDLCCRLGGEEFALLLPETDTESARAIAERCRRAVAEAAVATTGGEVPVTLSAGLAALPESEVADAGELLETADRALYRAKESGRNRVCDDAGLAPESTDSRTDPP